MSGFRHLGDQEVARLARLTVMRSSFAAPDGTTFERDVIRNLPVVAVVPLLADHETAVLVRQYRGPIDRELLEIPAGLCDIEGESLLDTVARELVEEAGLRAGRTEPLAGFFPGAGFSDQFVNLFLATELTEVPADRQGPEEQHMSIEHVRLSDVDALIASGELADAKSIIGLLLARDHLAA